ncbi:type II toxin-antitoxin system RelE/ParE family toxin [Acidobacteriota bacterium]
MSKKKVLFHPEAVTEARVTRKWYEERSPKAAEGFLRELDLAVEKIADSPKRWPIYIKGTRRYLFRRYPFFIVFREVENTIQVLAVAHGYRKPGYWKER